MISCCDWWPWTKPGYITMTRRQSNSQWSGGIAADLAPKIPSAKIRWKTSRLDFLGSRRHPPHWLSSKGRNYQRRALFISGWCNWKIFFKEKRRGNVTKWVLFLHNLAPAHWALALQMKLAYLDFKCLWSPTLFSVSGPAGLPPVPRIEKKLKVRHFRPTRSLLLPRMSGWTDIFLIFVWVACKS